MSEPRNILVFDTTLRDGEQSPGCSMNLSEKLEVARALRDLRVDIIEAGFPVSSPGDFDAVAAVAAEVQGPIIAAFARAVDKDIDLAGGALAQAARRRIHIFCATSEIHRTYKLKKSKEEIIRISVDGVRRAKTYTPDIEFTPEDAVRTEWSFLAEFIEAVIEAGVTTINVADTVGYAIPAQYADLITYIYAHVPNIQKAVVSAHCHNDLGLAVANSLAAIKAGAGQVECAINGLGERAGNAAMEEVIMALKTRSDYFNINVGIDTQRIYPVSRLVSTITGMQVQRNKAVVGENAFAHEAGIHQHGIMSNRATYEIMKPEDIGVPASRMVLGKHSGRHALKARVEEMGYHLSDEQVTAAFEDFKILADKKKQIFDADIEGLLEQRIAGALQVWSLEGLQTTAGSTAIPTATVKLSRDAKIHIDAATGDGPVDAIYVAIGRITGLDLSLTDYLSRALTSGQDAQVEVSIEVQHDGRKFRTRGLSTDILEASAKAYLSAVNRILAGLHVASAPAKSQIEPAAQQE